MELFSENIYGAQICCDGGLIVCDEEFDLAKYSKDGSLNGELGKTWCHWFTFHKDGKSKFTHQTVPSHITMCFQMVLIPLGFSS